MNPTSTITTGEGIGTNVPPESSERDTVPAVEIKRTPDGDRLILGVLGDLDLSSAAELEHTGLAGLDDAGTAELVLDLSRLDFTDSTGLRVFVILYARAQELGKRLILLDPSEATRRLLQVTGLDTVFTIR